MCSDPSIDFHVKISFLHLELTSGVGNLCISSVLCVHSRLFTFRFLAAMTQTTETLLSFLAVLLCNFIYHHYVS